MSVVHVFCFVCSFQTFMHGTFPLIHLQFSLRYSSQNQRIVDSQRMELTKLQQAQQNQQQEIVALRRELQALKDGDKAVRSRSRSRRSRT